MPRRTKEEAQQTRETLIEAAEVVFHRKGVSASSLNDIAKEAGVTRGAVYWHFKNKHDIFQAIVDRLLAPLDALHDQIEDPSEPDPLSRFRELLEYLPLEIARDPRRSRGFEIAFLKCEQTEANAVLNERHRQNYLDGSERIRKALEAAVNKGQLPADLDIERGVAHLHIQLTGIIYLWLVLPDVIDFKKEALHMIDSFFLTIKQNFGSHSQGDNESQ